MCYTATFYFSIPVNLAAAIALVAATSSSLWAQKFIPFSKVHAIVVILFLLITSIAVFIGRYWRNKPKQRKFELTLGTVMLAIWVFDTIYWQLPANFSLYESLPIQICDLATLIAPLALLTRKRKFCTLLYFWGIALCSQAFITPAVYSSPADIGFWLFWICHTSIVGGAIYLIAVKQYQPEWRDFSFAVIAGMIYFFVVLIFNLIFDVNYGFVGNTKPDNPSIIDVLGPWPARLFLIVLLAIIAFAILMLPWEIIRIFKKRRV